MKEANLIRIVQCKKTTPSTIETILIETILSRNQDTLNRVILE